MYEICSNKTSVQLKYFSTTKAKTEHKITIEKLFRAHLSAHSTYKFFQFEIWFERAQAEQSKSDQQS